MKIISFSLWGDNPLYIIGAIKNAILALDIYPGWLCRFYIDNVAKNNPNIKYLSALANTEIVHIDTDGDWSFNIFRFLPLSENVSYMISRDCDSRLSAREKHAVDEWMQSDKTFHILRDHPFQFNFPILGGMFGSKKIFDSTEIFQQSINEGYHSDQIFLHKYVWPLVQDSCLIHDSINNTGIPFPISRHNREFVGDSFDILDHRHPEYWQYIND